MRTLTALFLEGFWLYPRISYQFHNVRGRITQSKYLKHEIFSIQQTLSFQSLFLFGTDVSMIPCFRSSFLYGISGGIFGGLLTFLRTSRPLLSSHYGMGTFCVTTLGYWTWCRYEWSKKSLDVQILQSALQKQAAYEGTGLEEEIDAKAGLKSA